MFYRFVGVVVWDWLDCLPHGRVKRRLLAERMFYHTVHSLGFDAIAILTRSEFLAEWLVKDHNAIIPKYVASTHPMYKSALAKSPLPSPPPPYPAPPLVLPRPQPMPPDPGPAPPQHRARPLWKRVRVAAALVDLRRARGARPQRLPPPRLLLLLLPPLPAAPPGSLPRDVGPRFLLRRAVARGRRRRRRRRPLRDRATRVGRVRRRRRRRRAERRAAYARMWYRGAGAPPAAAAAAAARAGPAVPPRPAPGRGRERSPGQTSGGRRRRGAAAARRSRPRRRSARRAEVDPERGGHGVGRRRVRRGPRVAVDARPALQRDAVGGLPLRVARPAGRRSPSRPPPGRCPARSSGNASARAPRGGLVVDGRSIVVAAERVQLALRPGGLARAAQRARRSRPRASGSTTGSASAPPRRGPPGRWPSTPSRPCPPARPRAGSAPWPSRAPRAPRRGPPWARRCRRGGRTRWARRSRRGSRCRRCAGRRPSAAARSRRN